MATAVGAVPVILGHDGAHGLMVPPGDADALAGAIRSLVLDPARRRAIGRQARLRVQEWTLEAWADQIGAALTHAWGLPLKGLLDARRAAHVS